MEINSSRACVSFVARHRWNSSAVLRLSQLSLPRRPHGGVDARPLSPRRRLGAGAKGSGRRSAVVPDSCPTLLTVVAKAISCSRCDSLYVDLTRAGPSQFGIPSIGSRESKLVTADLHASGWDSFALSPVLSEA